MPNRTESRNHLQFRGQVVGIHTEEAVHILIQFGGKHVENISRARALKDST